MRDQARDPNRERESKQALAKIQHSEARGPAKPEAKDEGSAIVADPRNRLTDGKVDQSTKELKPSRR